MSPDIAHDTPLIATLAVGLALAFALGFLAARLRMPPLVGSLRAGVAIGPFTPGFVADVELAPPLAEIGVILLMFGVGIHFSMKDLLAVWKIAVPGAIAQIAVATGLGAGLAILWGWSPGPALTFGLALSVASTVVLLRALEAQNLLNATEGRIAVGWLIVEDLVMVLVLVLLPGFAGLLSNGPAAGTQPATEFGQSLWQTLALTLGKVAIFVVLMLVVGSRVFPWILRNVDRTNSRELFTLAVIVLSVGIAYGSAVLFGVSFALGAFFAGVVVSESDYHHRVSRRSQPLQDAFAVLFFVAVGMLFDPSILIREPLAVLGVVAIIVVGKSLAALAIVLMLGYPARTAFTVSGALAQIGEFSFVLAGLGITLKILPPESQSLIVAGALLSIALNPVVFATIGRFARPT